MSRPGCAPARRASVAVGVVLLLAVVALPRPAGAAVYAPLPQPGRAFLENLSVPAVDPGATTTLSFEVANPTTNLTLTSVVATFALYAFNAFPGDAVSGLATVAHPPSLSDASASGPVVNVTVGVLSPGGSRRGELHVTTSAATPSGTFAIRTALSFDAGGTSYLLRSRGWFAASLWSNATRGPNGSATVNLTMLNVSGVLPETAVLVKDSAWPLVLDVLLGVGLVLVGAGAWAYFRRTSPSRSGAG